MKLFLAAALSSMAAIFAVLPATAADDDNKFLSGYSVVIGDTGDRYDGWDDSDTRVYAEIRDHGHYHEHYFDSIASALFVLRERYGSPEIVGLEVPEYWGGSHYDHDHVGRGMIDGLSAWYLWDDERYSRGGTPLIIAFGSRETAEDYAWERGGEIMRFERVASRLFRWADRERSHIYWRGWDNDRWKDKGRWNNAWKSRWADFTWDTDWGWISIDLDLDDDDRWERDRGRGNGHGRGRGHDKGRGRGHRNHDHDRRYHDDDHRGRDNDRDRGRGRDNDRNDDRREGRDNDDDDDSSSESYRR